MTRNLQDGWGRNPWVDAQTEEEIPEPARETLTQTWGALKSFLFVTVMVQQSVVTATTYLPPPSKTASRSDPNLTPASLALVLLRTLSNLSFVITKFGGVTSTARTSVFPQLRRLFYSALDVLSTDRTASERFVTGLCQAEKQDATSPKSSKVMESSKMAFSLACIEQLVPNVDEERIQNHIFAMCTPYVTRLVDVPTCARITPLSGTFGIMRTGRFTNRHIQSSSPCYQPMLKGSGTDRASFALRRRTRTRNPRGKQLRWCSHSQKRSSHSTLIACSRYVLPWSAVSRG